MKLDASIETLITEIVEEKGFELVEVKYFSAGGKTVLRIFADGDNGILLNDCAAISRALSERLDEIDFGKNAYTLEISSPGLDRPLVTAKDFKRIIGKNVQLRLRDESKKNSKVGGTLLSVEDDLLTIETKKGEESVAIDTLLSGKLVI